MIKRLEEIRPWGTFAQTANFDKPQNHKGWSKRLQKNIEHFQSNYVRTSSPRLFSMITP